MKQIMLLLFILLFVRCDTTEPPQMKATLTLELEDVSCTEAWIMLKLKDIPQPAEVTLYKNNNAQNNILCFGDTLLYVDSLLPKQTYTFHSTIQPFNQSTMSSNSLSVTMMDTTSHNFTWQTWTFGEHSSSVLYDVAIIDENNIWAVGEIYMKDSLGRPDPNCYNAVHWNGQRWELIKIGGYGGYPRRTIFAFSANDIWFDGVIHWDGSKYTVKNNGWPLMPNGDGWQVNKMWGSSSNDLYAVGNYGNIAHWDGVKWRKIESPTTVDLSDVWGSPDGSIVWVCGYYDDKPGTFLLRSKGKSFELAYDGTANRIKILTDTISGRIITAYTPNLKKVLIGTTSGVYNALANTKGGGKRLSFTPGQFPGLPFRLRGTGLNDFTIVGEYSFIAHYNGYSWRYYDELWTDNTRLRSVAQKDNISVAVGSRYLSPIYSPAVIYVGRR